MGRFSTRSRGPTTGRSEARVELLPRWAAVGEALASDPACRLAKTLTACANAGRELAGDGLPLSAALDALRTTTRAVTRRDPSYDSVRAVGAGWSEATLGHLRELTCEDPLTGLASLPHLRSRLAELYRDQAVGRGVVREHHVLLVLDTPGRPPEGEAFGSALRAARLADTARTVFPGGLTAGRVGPERVAVLVRRDDRLPRRLVLVRALLDGVTPPVRVWVESLPLEDSSAAALLDELARR